MVIIYIVGAIQMAIISLEAVLVRRKKILTIIKTLYKNYIDDDISALGAQVTYYLILAFFPFLIFLVTVISYTNLVSPESLSLISSLFPSSVYRIIEDLIKYVLATRNKALISIGMIATVWSSSTGILAFMYGMNKAFKKKETRPFWKVRGLSLIFTLAFTIIVVFSIILVVFGELLGRHFFSIWGISGSFDIVWDLLRYAISVIILFIIFILFYVYIPNCSIRFKDAVPGALLSTIGWIVFSTGFSFYVNKFDSYSKIYGSIGAVIALLVWLNLNSTIVFIGSELNAILSDKHNCMDDRS